MFLFDPNNNRQASKYYKDGKDAFYARKYREAIGYFVLCLKLTEEGHSHWKEAILFLQESINCQIEEELKEKERCRNVGDFEGASRHERNVSKLEEMRGLGFNLDSSMFSLSPPIHKSKNLFPREVLQTVIGIVILSIIIIILTSIFGLGEYMLRITLAILLSVFVELLGRLFKVKISISITDIIKILFTK